MKLSFRNSHGILIPVIAAAILLIALVGVGVATTQGARFRSLASKKEDAADISSRTLQAFLNLPWADTRISNGIHPIDADKDASLLPKIDLSKVQWTVTDQALATGVVRLKQIVITTEQGKSLTGYKYDDF